MIDSDVHNAWNSAAELLPYMDHDFRDHLLRGELPGPRGAFPHAHRPWLHKAYNNYLIDVWLPRDPRPKGAMVIAPRDADRAAAEIRRVGEHPGIFEKWPNMKFEWYSNEPT